MFDSYEESVLFAADEDGDLSVADLAKFFKDHGTSLAAAEEDGYRGDLNAQAALHWLGY
jgi:hypothetical protein